jgi:hypothetical protein
MGACCIESVIGAADATMIELFGGMSTRQFAELIRRLRTEGAEPLTERSSITHALSPEIDFRDGTWAKIAGRRRSCASRRA